MTDAILKDLLEFLKQNKPLMQKNDLDTLYKKAYDDDLVHGTYVLSDFLINTCKIPVLNYMTKIPGYMFAGLSIKSLIIPENIKEISSAAFSGTWAAKEPSIQEVIVDAKTNQLVATSGTFIKITVREPIKQLNPPNCSIIDSIVIPKSCTRLPYGFHGRCFTIETPYRENQHEKLRVSEKELSWAKTHIKFIHEDTNAEEDNSSITND